MRWEMVWAVWRRTVSLVCQCVVLLQSGGYEPECSSFCDGLLVFVILVYWFFYFTRILTGTGDLILGEDCRRRPLAGCWARKAGAARCLSMLKARVDCIVGV